MTAVPGARDTSIDVICDGCGAVATTGNSVVNDDDLVWTVLVEIGWVGSPFASGQHRCPRCAVADPGQRPAAYAAADRRGTSARVTVHAGASATVIAAHGDVDARLVADLRAALTSAIAAGRPVVLDLERVTVIDAIALGVLVRSRQAARQNEVPLCLAAPSRFVLTVLHTMRLLPAFPVFDTRADALAALGADADRVHAEPLIAPRAGD
ncbi:anti-anti-sigma factor [Micromonospora pattaloongensis]|uniref:Anti-anti-sigma factor n=1 Tax=Micromonospora pattaloongensis TaxID=405436 RepID=A0A1H3QRG2_9ACTN|nr:STAS domain-containing protein [Micromonospora pattaloongensis]SDZ15671.1 anti-anti-sigma factor [Micromonospora pattaloongensis]